MIRPYEDKDNKEIEEMLIQEGIPDIEMRFRNYDTFVLEEDGEIKGFFTIKKEWGVPSIQHFCVNRKFRSTEMARKLAKAMKETVKSMGSSKLILHSKSEKLDKCIKYYFKKNPYAVRNDTAFFFVEV